MFTAPLLEPGPDDALGFTLPLDSQASVSNVSKVTVPANDLHCIWTNVLADLEVCPIFEETENNVCKC